jgi:C-terminal processing protease CtpA/Prc
MMKTVLTAMAFVFLTAGLGFGANPQAQFGGVGIDGVPRADGTIVVKQLVLGGPAQVAGIRQGDIIIQIDGTPTKGNDFKFLVEHRLRGRAGTPVMLKVKHPGDPKPQTFKLVRRQLSIVGAPKKEHH